MKKVKRLTFGDYIKSMPSSIIFRHLIKEHSTRRKIVSSELIDTIKKEIASEASCQARFKALSGEAQKICVTIYLFGSGGLKAVAFEHCHNELMQSFLVYMAQDRYAIKYYFGFQDTAAACGPPYASFLSGFAQEQKEIHPVSFLPARCLNDFSIVLILALGGQLKKKRDGTLVQAALVALRKLLHATNESCVFVKKRDDMNAVITLLCAYGTARGYLCEDGSSYTTTHTQITRWLSHPPERLLSDMIDFAAAYYDGWNMELFQDALGRADTGWFSTSFFPSSCRDRALCILRIMHYCGIVEAVSLEEDILWRRCQQHGVPHDVSVKQKVRILPDFSALLPQEAAPQVVYAFSLVGKISRLDKVYKGTVDRTVVNEALSRGIEGGLLLSYLSDWETPVNVIETVKEWIREFSRLCIMQAETVISFDEKTSRQIQSYHALAPLIEPLDAHTVFAIKRGHERETRDILIAMGFDPRVPRTQSVKPPTAERLLEQGREEEYTVSYDFTLPESSSPSPVTAGKYSAELKKLEISELYHVIDYAILMDHSLRFEYEGSPYIRQGVYTIKPIKVTNETEPFVEGTREESNVVKKYYIKRIARIGVVAL